MDDDCHMNLSFYRFAGCLTQSPGDTTNLTSPRTPPKIDSDALLVISGGDGYVDFRKGEIGVSTPEDINRNAVQPSHMMVWQLNI